MAKGMTAVHVTHEITGKIGGIGAVLQGLFTSSSYLEAVERSILVGPLFSTEGPVSERLGENGEVLYSSVDGFVKSGYHEAFRKIEGYFNAGIVYGRKPFVDTQTGIKSSPEVLLIDVRYIDKGPLNEFKRLLFEEFGIRSDSYENLWEYEQYVRLAPPAIAALKAIGADKEQTIVIAHEFMGMPTALAAILACTRVTAGAGDKSCDFKTIFYAHEVATMRRIVEKHPGHDTMFYNVMKKAHEENLYVSDVFGDQSSFFKHPLIEAAKYCDAICAVGNYVAKEIKFLAPEFETADVDITYNGIPAYKISLADKLHSKEKLQLYCKNLLGYRPDFIFTHVTRLVQSKGLWRDLLVLEHIDKEFVAQNKTAVMLLLATEVSQRRSSDIYHIEATYNWPVAHREGMPDLSGGEATFYTAVQEFNAKSRNIKIIFINQFGFTRKLCGKRCPENMDFTDIRKGGDVEFGLSIYEPFGIAPLEPLTFGGICVVSNVSGCAGFVEEVTGVLSCQSPYLSSTEDKGAAGESTCTRVTPFAVCDSTCTRVTAGASRQGGASRNGVAGEIKNVIIADYTNLENGGYKGGYNDIPAAPSCDGSRWGLKELLQIGQSVRNAIEDNISEKVAMQICSRLPKNASEMEDMVRTGEAIAERMSWDVVVKKHLLNTLQKALHKQRSFVRPAV